MDSAPIKNENVTDFGYAIKTFSYLAFTEMDTESCESLLVEHYTRGLSSYDTKRHVRLNQPLTLDKAISLAMQSEEFEISHSNRKPSYTEQINAVQSNPDKRLYGKENSNFFENANLQEITCYACYRKGHKRNQCPYQSNFPPLSADQTTDSMSTKERFQSNTFMSSQRPRAFQQNSRQRFDTEQNKNFSPRARNFQPRRLNEQFEQTLPQRLSPIHEHKLNAATASTFEPKLDASGSDVPIQENY